MNASSECERYAGYIAHYHLTQQKWDPGPFDFKEFCGKLRGALCFPVFPKQEPKPGQQKPLVPDETTDLKQDASALSTETGLAVFIGAAGASAASATRRPGPVNIR